MASKHWEQNKDATVYVGNIDERFSQELLSELMTQVGPIRQVHMPLDRVSQIHQGYGFVEYDTPLSADYSAKVLNGVRVWGKPIRVNKASADKQKAVDIGAELFINNLDPQVDEKILYDTFSRFGTILRQPNVVRDEHHLSKGYGFVSFDSFEASDEAKEQMNGQYLLSRQITVEYAYKKDGKGERHGDEAERKLAAEGRKHNLVPEQQVLPAGYHMTGPVGGAANSAPAAPPPVSAPGGFADAAVTPMVQTGPSGAPIPTATGIPPSGFGGPAPPGPNRMPAGFGNPPPQHLPPHVHPGRGGMIRPSAVGLPARPPPSTAGFPMGDFHPGGGPHAPGFRGAAVPSPASPGGVFPPANLGPASLPPGGFTGSVPGMPGIPPAGPPLPGFGAMPPPGFGPPGPPGPPGPLNGFRR